MTRTTTQKDRRAEGFLLFLVLLIVGGALGYAAFRAAVGEPELPQGDIETVSKGERVDLAEHSVAGKYTIYDFYADWCPPCRILDAELHELAGEHQNLAIRKIDIVDWTSEVVEQHGVLELPHLVLYGPDGSELAAGNDVFPLIAEIFDAHL